MPMDSKTMASMMKQYGAKKGKQVAYAVEAKRKKQSKKKGKK